LPLIGNDDAAEMFPAFVGIVGGCSPIHSDSWLAPLGAGCFKERLVQLLYMHEILPNVPICNSRLISSIGLPKLLEAAKYTKKKKKVDGKCLLALRLLV
jgi:hypothetical protein